MLHLLRPPLLQVNGVRVGNFLSPVKRQRSCSSAASAEIIHKENLSDNECMIEISPFKHTQTEEPASKQPRLQRAPLTVIQRLPRRSAMTTLAVLFPDTRLTLESLPCELFYMILTWLSPEDLLIAARVNRHWHCAVDDRSLWIQHFAFADEQPTGRSARWPSLWVQRKRQEERERRASEDEELFVDHPMHLRLQYTENLRNAFHELDQYCLMEQ